MKSISVMSVLTDTEGLKRLLDKKVDCNTNLIIQDKHIGLMSCNKYYYFFCECSQQKDLIYFTHSPNLKFPIYWLSRLCVPQFS